MYLVLKWPILKVFWLIFLLNIAYNPYKTTF